MGGGVECGHSHRHQIQGCQSGAHSSSIYALGSRGTYAYETLLNHLDALERQRTQEVMP